MDWEGFLCGMTTTRLLHKRLALVFWSHPSSMSRTGTFSLLDRRVKQNCPQSDLIPMGNLRIVEIRYGKDKGSWGMVRQRHNRQLTRQTMDHMMSGRYRLVHRSPARSSCLWKPRSLYYAIIRLFPTPRIPLLAGPSGTWSQPSKQTPHPDPNPENTQGNMHDICHCSIWYCHHFCVVFCLVIMKCFICLLTWYDFGGRHAVCPIIINT